MVILASSCIWNAHYVSSSYEYRNLFDKTPCEAIAKAILSGDNCKIEQLINADGNLVNYRDSAWGQSLLMYSVYFNNKTAVSILLKHGADPNQHEDTVNHRGDNPVIMACFYQHVDTEILEILLQNGGNPNSQSMGVEYDNLGNKVKIKSYAIQSACKCDLSKVNLLINYGANINLWDENNFDACPIINAAIAEKMDILYYLLIHNANYDCVNKIYNKTDTVVYSLCETLRSCEFELGSKEHIYKMKAVKFLQERGVDYYSTPIPNYVIEDAKRKYPDSWQEYLLKY